MKQTLVSILRDEKLEMAEFRRVAQRLAWVLAAEVGNYLPTRDHQVRTPLAMASAKALPSDVILVPVLRAGLSLLPSFLDFYPQAKVGFVGLRRDEETAVAHRYYLNLPKVSKETHTLILEPMLATGGSAGHAIEAVCEAGVDEGNVIVVGVISAPEALAYLESRHPKAKIVVAQQDGGLSKDKYIVPGLGDFGDRFFGTV